MRKLITCSLLQNHQCNSQSNDSPMQLKLIQYLGVKKYMMDKFIFRRKDSGYLIRKNQGKNRLYVDNQYQPPQGYNFETCILEASSNSVPICKLTPKQKNNNTVIIYAHGNSSDMSNSLMFIDGLCEHINATYIAFDYSGYGQSRVSDVGEQVISWVTQFADLKDIILWGFSLGTYPVVTIAAKYEVGGVILQCPIASISCIFYQQLSPQMHFENDHFANIDNIHKIKSKVLILHSSSDEILPIEHAKVLFNKYIKHQGQKKINFIQVSKIGHNSLHKFIITQLPNQLQNQVFHFILDIIYHSDSSSLKSKKYRMLKTQRPKMLIPDKIKETSNKKLSQLRNSKVQSLAPTSSQTTISNINIQNKTLNDLRMLIMEADIEQIQGDLKQIVVQEINGAQIAIKSTNKSIWKNKCLCLSGQNTQ